MRIIKELIPYVVIIVVVVLFRIFIATPVIVSGDSMKPTLKNRDILILNKLARKYNKDDIVVINANILGKKERIVKRVIGLPGDTVEYKNNRLYINGERTYDKFANITKDFKLEDLGYKKIPTGYYLVLGDNRNNSTDSRMLGLIKEKDILGKPILRIWPINKMGTI